MIVKLLTEHHLEFLSLKGGGRGSSESTLVKMSNCWKSHAAAHFSSRLKLSTQKRKRSVGRQQPTHNVSPSSTHLNPTCSCMRPQWNLTINTSKNE